MKKQTLFADILKTVTRYFLILVILVIIAIACSGITVVESGNVAVILRFGELVGETPEEQIHEPGLLLAFPYIIDEVIMVPTGSVIEQSITTYYTPDGTDTENGSYVITGDQNVAIISASVKYTITDPVKYALNVADVPAIVNACVSNAMLCEAAGSDVDLMLTSGKDAFARNSMTAAPKKLDAAGVGITLQTLELTTITMPTEVREVYNDVYSATGEAQTIQENANQYRERLIPQAHTTANGYVTAAKTEASAATAAATSALTEFWGILDEYKVNPEAVEIRLLTQKTAKILDKIGTVRLVQDGDSSILLMPKIEEEEDGES